MAFPTRMSPALPLLMRLSWLRWILARLPPSLLDALKPSYGGVGLLYQAADGRWTVDVAEDGRGERICFPTSAVERADGDLVLGFLHARHAAVYRPWRSTAPERERAGAGAGAAPPHAEKPRDEL